MTKKIIGSLLVLTVVGACSDDNGTTPDSSVDASKDVGIDGAPDLGPQPDAQITARFCGYLEDDSGMLVEAGDVIVCNEHECHTGTASATGAFCVYVKDPGDYLFHAVEKTVKGKHLGDMMFPTTLSQAEVQGAAKIDLGTIVMPVLGATKDLDPTTGGTLDLGQGSLTVPAGATVLPPLATEAKVALAVLDPSKLHPKLAASVSGKTVEAAFVIVPVGVTFSSPIAFELPAPAGLTAGTTLEIHRVHDEQGKVELKGEATVNSSAKLVEATGKGLSALGVLLFTTK